MRTTTMFCVALLLALPGCKQSETVNTTSSSETTSTVAEATTTAAATAPVTDSGASTSAMTATAGSTAAPAAIATTATTASAPPATRPAEGREPAKKTAGPTVTETASSTSAAALPKNLPPSPKNAPPANETMSTNPAASKSPVTAATSSNAALASIGQGIFKSQCVACHGPDASGNTAIGRKNNIPDFRSNAVQGLSDSELASVIANGKGPISSSAHKSKHLSTDQINAVVAYIRSLK